MRRDHGIFAMGVHKDVTPGGPPQDPSSSGRPFVRGPLPGRTGLTSEANALSSRCHAAGRVRATRPPTRRSVTAGARATFASPLLVKPDRGSANRRVGQGSVSRGVTPPAARSPARHRNGPKALGIPSVAQAIPVSRRSDSGTQPSPGSRPIEASGRADHAMPASARIERSTRRRRKSPRRSPRAPRCAIPASSSRRPDASGGGPRRAGQHEGNCSV